ncbi:MAG TPA: protein phosphatase 2C domain-containing protein [Iamia sp.]
MRMPWRRVVPSPAAIAGATDPGPRPENQDRWAAGPGWAVVCDGVGGHAGGAVAAQTALDVVVAHLDAGLRPTAATAERVLSEAAVAANTAVDAGRAAGPEVADMATTLTAAVAVPGRGGHRRWIVLQVGDSPAWRVGPTEARSITWDHNLVGDLVRTGALAPDEAIGHRGRHVVTRALGVAPTVEPEVFAVTLAPDETLVLASDGLSDVAGPDAAVAACATPDVGAAAVALVTLALDRGTMDNVTVVVAR